MLFDRMEYPKLWPMKSEENLDESLKGFQSTKQESIRKPRSDLLCANEVVIVIPVTDPPCAKEVKSIRTSMQGKFGGAMLRC